MAKLVCTHGVNAGEEFVLIAGPNVIGRSHECDIMLNDKLASRRHCQVIVKAKGEYVLDDMGSRHGTVLNRDKIGKPVSLKYGDVICVAQTRLVLSERAPGVALEKTFEIAANQLEGKEFHELIDDASSAVAKTAAWRQDELEQLLEAAPPTGIRGFFHRLFRRRRKK
ncbi:MAG: hypothetical protein A3K18_23350 [Lentisphaerae bacterium RIFOXYA12_64_32]|nr:MAG: hypothetical protein A3K18_23350 [Lentisphaerae bacterium RIFOXYA12_64_32]